MMHFPARRRATLSYMKDTTRTIRLDPQLERRLKRRIKRTGETVSEVVRDALRRQLALEELETIRRDLRPYAEARGWLSDEDVFRDIS